MLGTRKGESANDKRNLLLQFCEEALIIEECFCWVTRDARMSLIVNIMLLFWNRNL